MERPSNCKPDGEQSKKPGKNQPPQEVGEDSLQGRDDKSPERRALPNALDVLARRVRLEALDVTIFLTEDEYKREFSAVTQLEDELAEHGTKRDNLILDLYSCKTIKAIKPRPNLPLPLPLTIEHLSTEEFQQFRSRIEPMSDQELAEELQSYQTTVPLISRRRTPKVRTDTPEGAQKGLNNAFIRAAFHGETEKALEFLDKGADIHAGDELALRMAIYEGNINTVKELLARGANIHKIGIPDWAANSEMGEVLRKAAEKPHDPQEN